MYFILRMSSKGPTIGFQLFFKTSFKKFVFFNFRIFVKDQQRCVSRVISPYTVAAQMIVLLQFLLLNKNQELHLGIINVLPFSSNLIILIFFLIIFYVKNKFFKNDKKYFNFPLFLFKNFYAI